MGANETAGMPGRAAAIALGLALVACQSVVLDVGPPLEASTTDSAGSRGLDAGQTSGDARSPGPEDAGSGEPECVSLLPQPLTAAASLIGMPLLPLTFDAGEPLACDNADADGGEPPASSIYRLDGGELLMKRGGEYSLRWESSVYVSLRVYGGDVPCAKDALYEESRDALQFVAQASTIVAPTCRDVVPSVDVEYLRLLGNQFFGALEICEAPCPTTP